MIATLKGFTQQLVPVNGIKINAVTGGSGRAPPPDAARPPHPADRRNRPDGMAARNQVRPPLQRGNGHGALQGHSWRAPPRPNSARSAGGSHDRRIRPQPHARRRTPRAGAHRVTGGRMDEQIGRPSPCTNTLLTDIVEKVGC
ncbi:hypothetical protein GAY31_14635 [Azospirillum brasilense]|nr:hypothetical protein [Azospirillum brasilense]